MTGHATLDELRAVDQARAATRECPTDPEAWIRLGRLLFEPIHAGAEAIQALGMALELDPRSVAARHWLAAVRFHELADSEGALPLLRAALKLEPCNAECLSLLAACLRDTGAEPAELVGLLERAVATQPDWRTPREQLVQALVESGHLDHARKGFLELIALPITQPPSDPADRYFEEVVTGRSRAPNDLWREAILGRLKLGDDARL